MNGVNRLPDCYQKDSQSVNDKLLEINNLALKALTEDMLSVYQCLDLNNAVGKTLDLYGGMLKQKRGLLNDEQYRYMLLAKIGKNNVQGDYESIMDALVLMFHGEQGDIVLDDLELNETDAPCVVSLTRFPIYVLVNAGFSSLQAVEMIKMLLPVCVTLSASNFEGTFEFAQTEHEYAAAGGFADIEQTLGGYLGLLLGDDDKITILPI